ncbi:non-specific lipid transfer protein GPI-anchored 30 [Telopea speciosissima]|uniref:non-specific lipid transfer protein GPI-anchored 30 n=1 Tax=Telopea speciosissima TaxID=54955 RepID=UPI001CC82741|nr:non-specific lipid transfer protein GPI-anchored 30 [Telopea speciosissima]
MEKVVGGCSKRSGFFVMVAILLSLVSEGEAQDTSCLNQLVPCLNYLQRQGGSVDSNPPKSCCDPLKSVIDSNPECLCTMITNRATNAAEQAGINVTKAQDLPDKCGQTVNPIACLTNTGSSPNTGRAESNSASDFSFMGIVMVSILSVSFQILWASNSI